MVSIWFLIVGLEGAAVPQAPYIESRMKTLGTDVGGVMEQWRTGIEFPMKSSNEEYGLGMRKALGHTKSWEGLSRAID